MSPYLCKYIFLHRQMDRQTGRWILQTHVVAGSGRRALLIFTESSQINIVTQVLYAQQLCRLAQREPDEEITYTVSRFHLVGEGIRKKRTFFGIYKQKKKSLPHFLEESAEDVMERICTLILLYINKSLQGPNKFDVSRIHKLEMLPRAWDSSLLKHKHLGG